MKLKRLTVAMIEEWQEDTEFLEKLCDSGKTYKQAVDLLEGRGTAFMRKNNWPFLPNTTIYSHTKSVATKFQLLKFAGILASIKQKHNHQRQMRKNLLGQMGLSSLESGGQFLEVNGIPIYKVAIRPRASQYPPHNHWVYEQEETGNQWRAHLAEGKMKDKRNRRCPLHFLDPQKLQLDIPAGESAIFVDSTTGKLVGLVLRNVSGGNPQVLEWATGVALEATEWQKSVRVSPLPPNIPPTPQATVFSGETRFHAQRPKDCELFWVESSL